MPRKRQWDAKAHLVSSDNGGQLLCGRVMARPFIGRVLLLADGPHYFLGSRELLSPIVGRSFFCGKCLAAFEKNLANAANTER